MYHPDRCHLDTFYWEGDGQVRYHLQMRKPRPREVKPLAQVCTEGKGRLEAHSRPVGFRALPRLTVHGEWQVGGVTGVADPPDPSQGSAPAEIFQPECPEWEGQEPLGLPRDPKQPSSSGA